MQARVSVQSRSQPGAGGFLTEHRQLTASPRWERVWSGSRRPLEDLTPRWMTAFTVDSGGASPQESGRGLSGFLGLKEWRNYDAISAHCWSAGAGRPLGCSGIIHPARRLYSFYDSQASSETTPMALGDPLIMKHFQGFLLGGEKKTQESGSPVLLSVVAKSLTFWPMRL
jgi:hypothetical protein